MMMKAMSPLSVQLLSGARDDPAAAAAHTSLTVAHDGGHRDAAAAAAGSLAGTSSPSPPHRRVTLFIGGMTCSSCANTVEAALCLVDGVASATVNVATEKAVVVVDDAVCRGPRSLVEAVEAVGFDAGVVPAEGANDEADRRRRDELRRYRRDFGVALAGTVPIAVLMLVLDPIPAAHHALMARAVRGVSWMALAVAVCATPVQFVAGARFHREAWTSLRACCRRRRRVHAVGMALLVSLGSSVAYAYGLVSVVRAVALDAPGIANADMFMTAAMLLAFVALGKWLEAVAKGRTSDALRQLQSLQVASATLLEPPPPPPSSPPGEQAIAAGGGVERRVPIELVQRGDVVRVVRGAAIPADGVVVAGRGRVDESMLTGESRAVAKQEGDRVLGATLNVDGVLCVRVTSVGRDSALSQIIALVEDAQTSKAPIQALADRVAAVLVPVVVALAAGTFAVWLAVGALAPHAVRAQWKPHATDNAVVVALNFAIATLVVACPCALGLATPTAVMVGTGVGARLGVLVKGGAALEAAHGVTTVVFDKTGTLTLGRPTVVRMEMLPHANGSDGSGTRDEVVRLAGRLASASQHPLSVGIAAFAAQQDNTLGGDDPSVVVTQVEEISGRGVRGVVSGREVAIGSAAWMAAMGCDVRALVAQDLVHEAETAAARTVVVVAVARRCVAWLALADAPRADAAATLRELQHGLGLDVWMLTGDDRSTALAVARELGLRGDRVLAQVLPGDKAAAVRALQRSHSHSGGGGVVAMVGDGINDTPALAQADVGIAVGAGADVAVAAASIVLLQSKLWGVVAALALARATVRRIRCNYVWALLYNGVLLPVAAGVLAPAGLRLPPVVASAAMALSSVSVVASSLLLKRFKPPVCPAAP